MADIKNILFIRFKSMGDVVFTLPAIRMLRENFPHARITYLTSAENEPIAAGFEEVDEVLVMDRRIYKQRSLRVMGAATLDFAKRLRRGRFSLVIDTQCYGETALMALYTGARQRWGFRLGKRLRRLAYTRSIPRPDNLHPVDANLKLLTEFGLKPVPIRNRMRLPDRGRAEARQFFAQHGLNPSKPTLFIQPFTSSAHKNWPLEKHLAVADHWRLKGVQTIFGGGPAEREQLKPAILKGYAVCAGLSLPTVAWILSHAKLVLGGDTGLLHLALATGKRVLMLFLPYGPGGTLPYGHVDWIITPTSGRVATIPVATVNAAVAEALAAEGGIPAARRG